MSGSIYGANQFRVGVADAKNDRPGEGTTIAENFAHVTDTPFLNLALNTAPEGLVVQKDADGKNIASTEYQFWITSEPGNFVDGLGHLQYNSLKGVIAGTTLALSAPVKDTIAGKNKRDEEEEKGVYGAIQMLPRCFLLLKFRRHSRVPTNN